MPRRTPNLVITIPPYPAPSEIVRPQRQLLSTKPLFRILPWVVGATLVLWIFVLQANKPPRLKGYTPRPHYQLDGYKLRPFHRPQSQYRPQQQGSSDSDSLDSLQLEWARRAESVRNAFLHAYNNYKDHASPYDELLPVTGGKKNRLNGWALPLFGSLDTMLAMNLNQLFDTSLPTVANLSYSTQQGHTILVHETILHHLGGLLSAYAISKEPFLLTRADDLAKLILPAFNSPSGFPLHSLQLNSNGTVSTNGQTTLSWSQIMSGQLELTYLAHLTGRCEYHDKTAAVLSRLYSSQTTYGLFPTNWDPSTGLPANGHFSIAEDAQAGHRSLLNKWLLSGRTDKQSLELYLRSINGIIENLLFLSPNRQLLYVTDIKDSIVSHKLSQQSCSLPSLLTLAVDILGIKLPLRDRELHLWAAQGLAYTCWVTFADQVTGLGPEEVQMDAWTGDDGEPLGQWIDHVREWTRNGKKGSGPPGTEEREEYEPDSEKRDYVVLNETYSLRPELIESFYTLWKSTKNERWRERGWKLFESIEEHARAEFGYASVLQVDQIPPPLKDETPSHFFSQTLKYLYLLFADGDIFPLRSWVFNAAGHPFPVFDWYPWEVERYRITAT